MTAALEGSEWSAARPGRTLPPGKTLYPFYRRLGGPQGGSGRAENLVPTGDSIPDRPARSSVAIPTQLPGLYIYIYIYIYIVPLMWGSAWVSPVPCEYALMLKQESQRTHNVTVRRVRATTVTLQKQSITYSECMSVALVIRLAKRCAVSYCHLWPARLCHIFPHYLINGTIFGEKVLSIKCVLGFFAQILSEAFLIIRKIRRHITINIRRWSRKPSITLVKMLLKLEFSRQIFEKKIHKYEIFEKKYTNTKFLKKYTNTKFSKKIHKYEISEKIHKYEIFEKNTQIRNFRKKNTHIRNFTEICWMETE